MKQTVDELAIFGGQPAYEKPLHVGRPNTGDRQRFLARVNDLLDRRWLSNHGPFLSQFEKRVAAIHGARHCVATSNGTVGLELVVRALGLAGEVIVPAYTFVASAHALYWHGVKPIFADVDRGTHTLDPRRVEGLITPQTSAILGVHLWGRPCAVEALADIAAEHDLHLVFDAAHAFGCAYGGRKLGEFGIAQVLSFHATKVLNTFEGGAVLTNDDDLARRLRLIGDFGFLDYDQVVTAGINAKMSEISAAMGLTMLEGFTELVAVNLRNYRRYRRMLAGLPGIRLIEYDHRDHNNYHYVVVEVDQDASGITRDQLASILWLENIRARRYFYPGCHRAEPYVSGLDHVRTPLPVTEELARSVLCLPTGTAMRGADIDTVCNIIRLAVTCSSDIRIRLNHAGFSQLYGRTAYSYDRSMGTEKEPVLTAF